MNQQFFLKLPPFARGFHIITGHIEAALSDKMTTSGLLHIFIRHTSAGICINENADPDVLTDFNMAFDMLVPEKRWPYVHTLEGPDDMPAHIKSVMTGTSVSIPIVNGKLGLGMWQGIYLCEFRNRGGSRELILTVFS